MEYWIDIHAPYEIDPTRIAGAAFGVSPATVAVAPRATQQSMDAWKRQDLFALIQHERRPDAETDDRFPVTLAVAIRRDWPACENPAVLERIAQALGAPILSDIDVDGPDVWRLFWADGTSTAVYLDDDDNVILSDTDRNRLQRIIGMHRSVAAA